VLRRHLDRHRGPRRHGRGRVHPALTRVPFNNIISRGDTAEGAADMASKESAKGDAGKAQVQSQMDEFTAKGYRGEAVDPTPNENYTVAGVTGGAPTPETDLDAEAEGRAASGVGTGPLAAAKAEAEAVKD